MTYTILTFNILILLFLTVNMPETISSSLIPFLPFIIIIQLFLPARTQRNALIAISIISLLVVFVLNSNQFDYAKITDVDYKAIVVDEPNSNGKVLITERLTFDIHALTRENGFWELWRDLPENEVDGVKVKYKVNSVKQILEDGSEIIYEKSPKLYWYDADYVNTNTTLGPGKYFHSEGPYDERALRYECLMLYIDNVYRDKMTFEIEYEMENAVLRYNDCSELYLSFYSGKAINYLNSFKAQVLIPNENMPKKGNYISHTYGTTSNKFPFEESATINPGYHTFSIDLDKSDLKFRPYNEYLEIAIVSFGEDKNIFSKYASKNMFSDQDVLADIYKEMDEYDLEPTKYVSPKFYIFLICSAGAVLTIWIVQKIDKNFRKKHLLKPDIDYTYFRDIPSDLDPYFASRLTFCKTKPNRKIDDEYGAILLSLVRKKYIEIEKIDPTKKYTKANTRIILKYDFYEVDERIAQTGKSRFESLTLTEKYYFNLLEGFYDSFTTVEKNLETRRGISLATLENKIARDYSDTPKFVKNMLEAENKIGINDGYFTSTNPRKFQKTYRIISYIIGIIGILILTLCNYASYQTRYDLAFGAYTVLGLSILYSAYYLYKNSKDYILLSSFGENEYSKWKGLYNFLNSDTLMNEREIIELPIWEKYLVYATAFGISKKVTAALKVRCPEYISSDTSSILGNNYCTSNVFRHYSHSFTRCTRNSYSANTRHSDGYRSGGGYTTSYTGSYGGHSGYGGGGRGGGGGRRRSLKSNILPT